MNGLPLPNYTQVSNYLLDEWMSKLTHAEFKFIILIVRYTSGFHRREAHISFSHFEKKCNINKKTARNISKKFEDLGWIKVIHGSANTPNKYEICLCEEVKSNKDNLGVSHPQGRGFTPPGVGVSHPHNKERKEIKKNNIQKKVAAQAAVVLSCLKEVEIPEADKKWLSARYTESEVSKALEFCTSPQTKIKTTLVAALKWACDKRPTLPRNPNTPICKKTIHQQIKERWGAIDGKELKTAQHNIPIRMNILSEYTEFTCYGRTHKMFEYKDFTLLQLEKYLQKEFNILEGIK